MATMVRLVALSLVAVSGCGGPQPPADEPPTQDVAIPEPLPSPPPLQVRCTATKVATTTTQADRVGLLPSDGGFVVALVGPSSVRLANAGPEGELTEIEEPLVKLSRSLAVAAGAGPGHLVVADWPERAKRGKSPLDVSRFSLEGQRVGKSLRVERTGVTDAPPVVACTTTQCLLLWREEREGAAEPAAVARLVTLEDAGPVLGDAQVELPGVPALVEANGDALEVVVAEKVHTVAASGELDQGVPLLAPRGGHLRLARSPTGSTGSMFVEAMSPYGLTVAVAPAGDPSEALQTRLWPDASLEERFDLAAGQLGFGAAWAKPEGASGPYAEEGADAEQARVFFRGFSVRGVPHGEETALTEQPAAVASVSVLGLADGYAVAWSSPARNRRESIVGLARLSCRELEPGEGEAVERSGQTEQPPAPPGGATSPPAEGGEPQAAPGEGE